MTDPTPDPLDDLASALLDGATTAEETARASEDPAVADRVAAFERVRDAIGEPVEPPPAAVRDAAVQAALAAFDDSEDTGGDRYGRPRRVVPLGARRLGRPGWARAVGIAAAVVLVAAVVPVLLGGDDRDGANDEDVAQALDDALRDRTAMEADDGAAAAGPPGAGGTESATLAASAPDFGPHPDLQSLLAAVRGHLETPAGHDTADGSGAPAPPPPEIAACLARAAEAAGAEGSTTVLAGRATLDGHDVAVVVVEDGQGGRAVAVLDAGQDCEPLASEPI